MEKRKKGKNRTKKDRNKERWRHDVRKKKKECKWVDGRKAGNNEKGRNEERKRAIGWKKENQRKEQAI